jgi:hypothetical protein
VLRADANAHYQLDQPVCPIIHDSAKLMARLARVSTCKTTNEPEEQALTCGFTADRVTGIEPALSAWESVRSALLCGLTCDSVCPRVTVRDRSSPGLLAR